ncbi:MAG: biotin--[acetyl-CoA-carboxylase] ligase [Deltaproteobacteria bacterium HGW-Deltaproteobacteria-21]|nr:MAG: biotin--[acetyl-CoA-carboxylase] ligase [Deltaproteobacteria bacterium HGW-Deltaproteobacteria-21]
MDTRERLLEFLRAAEGTWVSGDDLARRVAITRSAVWKHVRRLREEGCAIESSPRKGYLLREPPDRLNAGIITTTLRTQVFGKREIVVFSRIESTNTSAKSMALAGAPEGTLVIADTQTSGGGRKGRTWYSPVRDGLYASIILRPNLLLSQAGRIPIFASLAVAESLVSLGLSGVSLKWPNDILVRGKKIAGILTEVGAEMDAVDYMIIGVGINVNTPRFPEKLQRSATSFFLETGTRIFRNMVLTRYLTLFEKYCRVYRRGVTGRLLARWKDLAGIMGRHVVVESAGRTSGGLVQGLDEDGALIVQDPKAGRVRVFSGDVRLQKPS